jgi:hypothetical protein
LALKNFLVRNQNFITVNIVKDKLCKLADRGRQSGDDNNAALSISLAQCPAGTPSPLSPSTQLAADVDSSFSRHGLAPLYSLTERVEDRPSVARLTVAAPLFCCMAYAIQRGVLISWLMPCH